MRRDNGHEESVSEPPGGLDPRGLAERERLLEEGWARLQEAEACWDTRRQQLDCRLAELAAARGRVEAAQTEFQEARRSLDRLEAHLDATRTALNERERLLAEREAAAERRLEWLTGRERLAGELAHASPLGLGSAA